MLYVEPNWPAPSHIKAYTTTRLGWTRESRQTHIEGHATLEKVLALPSAPIWLKQTHSHIALEATPEQAGKEGDASFTSQTNRVCVIETADCLPLLICNKQGTMVAAIHAGWRGLASGIIEATIDALHQPTNELLVWLGPAIGPQKFEVGQDVYDAFTSRASIASKAFTPHTPGKWFANLYSLATMRLQACSVTQIYGGDFCTYTQEDLFFSYRRDKGMTGRMASVIWISK